MRAAGMAIGVTKKCNIATTNRIEGRGVIGGKDVRSVIPPIEASELKKYRRAAASAVDNP